MRGPPRATHSTLLPYLTNLGASQLIAQPLLPQPSRTSRMSLSSPLPPVLSFPLAGRTRSGQSWATGLPPAPTASARSWPARTTCPRCMSLWTRTSWACPRTWQRARRSSWRRPAAAPSPPAGMRCPRGWGAVARGQGRGRGRARRRVRQMGRWSGGPQRPCEGGWGGRGNGFGGDRATVVGQGCGQPRSAEAGLCVWCWLCWTGGVGAFAVWYMGACCCCLLPAVSPGTACTYSTAHGTAHTTYHG